VDQSVVAQVADGAQGVRALEQFRTADRKDLFIHQWDNFEPRPVPAAKAHRYVNILAGEIDESHRSVQPDIDIGMLRGEALQARDKPLRSDLGRDAHYEVSVFALRALATVRWPRDRPASSAYD
jgi:hypothetical protein